MSIVLKKMKSHHQAIIDVKEGVDRFLRSAFTQIVVEGPPLDAESIQRNPLMIASTHRSHVDYYIAGHMLIFRNFKNLRFAAGANLTRMPYIGPRFKAFGAFTVEREMAFERNYVQNLCNRVVSMMGNREAVIVFPEGGRSYAGSTLELKNGILGAAVLLQANHPDEDTFILPMAISYECPPDAPWFEMLLTGKKYRKRTQPYFKRLLGNLLYFGADLLAFGPFILGRKWNKKYGRVFIDYGDPLSVRSVVDIQKDFDEHARDVFFQHRVSMQKVSKHLRQRLFGLYRMLPMHLLAILLHRNGTLMERDALMKIPELLASLRNAGRNMKTLDTLEPAQIFAVGKQELLKIGAASLRGDALIVRKKVLLNYCAAPVLEIETSGNY